MKAVNQNKVYIVDEKTMESYARRGFDIYDDNGKIVMHGAGKTVPYSDYDAVKKENEDLKKQVAALSAKDSYLEKESKKGKKSEEAEKSVENKDGE